MDLLCASHDKLYYYFTFPAVAVSLKMNCMGNEFKRTSMRLIKSNGSLWPLLLTPVLSYSFLEANSITFISAYCPR